jgi:hypothetical protein
MKSDDEFCSSCGKKRFQFHDLSREINFIETKMIEKDSEYFKKNIINMNLKALWYKSDR